MDVPTHEELLSSIDNFLARHPKVGEARFGRDATGEPGLVERLRGGSSPTLKILNRIKNYMAAKDAELAAAAANRDEFRTHSDCSAIDDEDVLAVRDHASTVTTSGLVAS